MHYQTLLFGALLATTTTTVFAKSPFVHSFYNADCTGPDAGDKVSIKGLDCVPFDSKYDAVQVNFGTFMDQVDSLEVFSDDKCLVYAGKAVTSPRADNTPAQCVLQSVHGAKWGSVRTPGR